MPNTVANWRYFHHDQPAGGILNPRRVELQARRFGQSLFSAIGKRGQRDRDLVIGVDHMPPLAVDARGGGLQFQPVPLPAEVMVTTPPMRIEQGRLKVGHDLILFQIALEHRLGEINRRQRCLPLHPFDFQLTLAGVQLRQRAGLRPLSEARGALVQDLALPFQRRELLLDAPGGLASLPARLLLGATFALPLGMWPKNRALAQAGTWTDEKGGRTVAYRFDAILEVTGALVGTPYGPGFNPLAIPRTQVIGDNLAKLLDQIERVRFRPR